MLEGWEIRQPVYLHRIRDTRIGYAINQWRIDLSHSFIAFSSHWLEGRTRSSLKHGRRRKTSKATDQGNHLALLLLEQLTLFF